MKKALVITLVFVIVTFACLSAALIWSLQSPYATKITNYLLEQYSPLPVTVVEARYEFPDKLYLDGVEIKELQQDPVRIEQVQLWLNTESLLHLKPELDSLVINGVNLQKGLPSLSGLKKIKVHQIAITNLDYSNGRFIARDADIQIKNPQFPAQNQLIPYGTIQFSADQIYWQQEAFNQVLVDIDYKEVNSTLYGASFEWRGGEFSGQAEQYKQGWSLVNVTIDKLRLDKGQWKSLKKGDWSPFYDSVFHINSLDLLNTTVDTGMFRITNANLSLEDLYLSGDIWQQSDGYLSLSAESIGYLDYLFLEPAFESYFDRELVTVEEFSFEFERGLIRAVAEFTPQSAYFKNLSIDGLEWIYEEEQSFGELSTYLSELDQLLIDNLEIKRSQFIQLAQKPNWQVTGLSLEGNKLTLIDKGKPGLWEGDIRLSATQSSYQYLLSTQPLVEMKSEGGIWSLTEAFIPLESGLIEATASYDLSLPSQPWRIEAFADGLPLELLTESLSLPIEAQAVAEFQLSLNGLGGDELMLRNSLSGEISGSLRDSYIIRNEEESSLHAFESSDFSVKADRGRISIAPVSVKSPAFTGNLAGEVDLLRKEGNFIDLEITDRCAVENYDLLNNRKSVSGTCP